MKKRIPWIMASFLAVCLVMSIVAPYGLGELLHPEGNPWAHRFTDVHDYRAATFIVAASDSENRYDADYFCDGTADEVQIQAAIDALPAGGGRVLLLDGTYDIAVDSHVDLISNLVLEGQGPATILSTGTPWTDVWVLYAASASGPYENIAIKNLQIDIGDPAAAKKPIQLYDTTGFLIEGVILKSGTTNRLGQVYLMNCDYVKVLSSTFDGTCFMIGTLGTALDDTTIQSNDVLIQGNTFKNQCLTGYAIGGVVNRFRIIGNDVESGTIDTSISRWVVVDGNTVTGYINGRGIYMEGSRDGIISNNIITDCEDGIGITDNIAAYGNHPGRPGHILIEGNHISDMSQTGISIEGTRYVSILDNHINTVGRHGIIINKKTIATTDYYSHYCKIEQNDIFNYGTIDASSRGIYLVNNSDYNTICDNTIDGNSQGNARSGIGFDATSDNNTYVRNTIRGFAVKPIDDDGANNKPDSICFPFVYGSVYDDQGWDIDLDTEFAIAYFQLPLNLQGVRKLKIWAYSVVTEADAMRLEFYVRGAGDDETWSTHTYHGENRPSTITNFAAGDIIHWEDVAGAPILQGGDSGFVKVLHEAAGDGDCETDARFRCIELEYY